MNQHIVLLKMVLNLMLWRLPKRVQLEHTKFVVLKPQTKTKIVRQNMVEVDAFFQHRLDLHIFPHFEHNHILSTIYNVHIFTFLHVIQYIYFMYIIWQIWYLMFLQQNKKIHFITSTCNYKICFLNLLSSSSLCNSNSH